MSKAYEEVLDFITRKIPPQDVLEFSASKKAKLRIEGLIAKSKVDGLLPDEESEVQEYLQLEHLMRMAKAWARRKLAQ
jgi:hypothetical protein